MPIYIEKLSRENARDVFDFEMENKLLFEKNLPPRPEGYFDWGAFQDIVKELLKEQSHGECALYLIRNAQDQVVGRINLQDMKKTDGKSAELGYRIGKAYQGKGIASKAVELIISESVKTYGLDALHAGTSTENSGSQRVLEKNGFKIIGKEENVMMIQGKWIDGLLYRKAL